MSNTDEQRIKLTKKRVEVNDIDALYMLGCHYFQGSMGLKKDLQKANEYYNKAAELGSNEGHHTLGTLYENGIGVEKDENKALHHYRLAAIGGMHDSRHALGILAYKSKNQDMELAMKHWIMAAELGVDESLEHVKSGYKQGCVEKDVFAKALRAHKAASDEVKSDLRDAAVFARARATHQS